MTHAEERRYTSGVVEIRKSGDRPIIEGYGAVFNRLSRNLGGYKEQVDPAFFNKSKGDGWPNARARWEHDDMMLLGTVASGALTLGIDGVGLRYAVEPPEGFPPYLIALVARGDIRNSSFAFRTFEEDWGLTADDFPLRTLLSGQLIDVAPVGDPAYPDATAGLRSLAQRCNADFEEVRAMAQRNELRKLLVKSGTVVDLGKPKVWGRSALVKIDEKRDPWA